MTREEAKQLLPIIKAYSDGKKIQVKCEIDSKALTEKWIDVTNPDLDITGCYRIKPESEYRPFKNAEECWQEMQKHAPFGWIKDDDCLYNLIENISCDGVLIANVDRYEFDEAMGTVTFADGTPFGMKEEDNA